jgi:hypothetical protein
MHVPKSPTEMQEDNITHIRLKWFHYGKLKTEIRNKNLIRKILYRV